jgi:hypothetical protein
MKFARSNITEFPYKKADGLQIVDNTKFFAELFGIFFKIPNNSAKNLVLSTV